ncbi:uncharacterized protein LOC111313764 isoform X2 [Durio zibethinus]|uniref:Uncharacterized protein LOC111313764 isoform X2 n=1 Tax=Durio zibethinus TaxID=66656 RepID=A0A6P6AZD7_DURZI|nr:uncharacterized protein LOC111313764 isoform X2 [Durio zibethinus]
MEYTAEQQRYQQQYQYQQQAYEYDPSQHDQSAAYYAYANQQQQQQYQYYPPQESYSQQYPQFYQEAAPIHPPGVPLDHHNQATVFYPPQSAVEPQYQQMQTAYRGGRRGGRPFRGGSRGHVGNRGLRPDGTAPPRNRGHGHSGSRHFASNGVTSSFSNSVLDPSSAAAVMPPSALVPGQSTVAAQVPAAPLLPPPRMAWCELCRVDCNRPEILEQHKNGKRHKKNLQAHEEMQKLNKVITGQQSVQVPNSGSEVVKLKKVEASEEKQQQETSPSLAATNDNKKETEKQKDIVNKSEVSTTDPVEAKMKLKDPSEARGRGFKRKMRGGRGSKYMKCNEGPRRPVEPPKPKGGIPFMCELCNVKCESQVVFNSHLAGKKHVANLKRFHGHQALYGEAGLQALYPPNFNASSSSFIPQIQQGLTDPQVVLAQLLTYVLSQAQVPGLAAPQLSLPAATLAPAQIPLSSSDNQYPHMFTQGSLATSEMREVTMKAEAETGQHYSAAKSEASPFAGNNKAESQTSESEKNDMSRQQSFTAKFEVPPTAGSDVKVGNGALDLENKAVMPPMDNPTCATSEYLAIGDKPFLSSTSECKTVSLDPVDESGSNNDSEEPEEDPEEEVEDDSGEQNK